MNSNRLNIALACAALFVWCRGAAAAEPPQLDGANQEARGDPRLSANLTFDTTLHTGRSFDFFSEDDVVTAIGLSVGYAVWRSGAFAIVPELGLARAKETSSGIFDSAIRRTELATVSAYAGVSARYELAEFFEPHARLAAGADFVNASIRADDGTNFEDTSLSPTAAVGIGFSLKTPDGMFRGAKRKGPSMVLALQFEGGYLLAAPVELSLLEPDRDGRITLEDASLGELVRSAPYLRVAASVRF